MQKKVMYYKIVARCSNGHEQTLRMEGFTREQVEIQAGLMDGTSPFYVYPPKEDGSDGSAIGKCAQCGKPFKCTVTEV